jgi:hypothetical protein
MKRGKEHYLRHFEKAMREISRGLFLAGYDDLDDCLKSGYFDAEEIYRDVVSAAAGAICERPGRVDGAQYRGLVGMDYAFEETLGADALGFAPSDDVCDIVLGRARSFPDTYGLLALLYSAERICIEQVVAGDCTADSDAWRLKARSGVIENILRLREKDFAEEPKKLVLAHNVAKLLADVSAQISEGLKGLSIEQVYEVDTWEGDRNEYAEALYNAESDLFSRESPEEVDADVKRFGVEFFRPAREMTPERKAEIAGIIAKLGAEDDSDAES